MNCRKVARATINKPLQMPWIIAIILSLSKLCAFLMKMYLFICFLLCAVITSINQLLNFVFPHEKWSVGRLFVILLRYSQPIQAIPVQMLHWNGMRIVLRHRGHRFLRRCHRRRRRRRRRRLYIFLHVIYVLHSSMLALSGANGAGL